MCYLAQVAPSCGCLWGEGLVWLIGAVVCLLAAVTGPIIYYHVQWMTAFALQHHRLLPINCHFRDYKARLDRLFTV